MNPYQIILMMITALCTGVFLILIRKGKFFSPFSVFCLTILGGIAVYHNYLLANAPYLYGVSDGIASYLPRFKEIIRNMQNGWNWWDFSLGFGAFEPINSPVCVNPFVWISLIAGSLFGETALETSLAWMQVLKMGFVSFFLFHFLDKLKVRQSGCFYAGIALAFSGTVILRGFWIFFTDECLLAVLLLYCVELMYQNHKWYLVSIVVCFIGISLGIYYLYLYALILTLYITGRYVIDGKPAAQYPFFILKCAGIYLFGIGLSGFYIIGVELFSTFGTARFAGSSNDKINLLSPASGKIILSALMSLFGTDTMGTFEKYSGILNYLERPLLYTGTGSLFLIIYALKYSSGKSRKAIISIITLIVVYLLFPVITNLFNAFILNVELHAVSYRLSSLWIVIAIVSIAGYGLSELTEENHEKSKFSFVIGIISVLLLGTMILIARKSNYSIDQKMIIFAFGMIAVWIILPIIFKYRKKSMMATELIIILFSGFEMVYSARNTVNGSLNYATASYQMMNEDPLGYYGEVNEIMDYLHETDRGIYRVGGIRPFAMASRYSNPMYFGYYDSSYYTNIDQNTYDFTRAIDPEAFDIQMGSKYSIGVGGALEPSEITAYKYYVVDQTREDSEAPFGYEKVRNFGDLTLYKNKYPLSLGITFDKYILTKDFEKYTVEQRRKLMMHAVVLDRPSKQLKQISEDEIKKALNEDNEEYVNGAESLQNESLKITNFQEDDILGKISVSDTRKLVLSVPAVKGWHMLVDGKEVEIDKANLGFIGKTMTKGEHTIRLYYRLPLLRTGVVVSVVSLLIMVVVLVLNEKSTRRNIK